MIENGIIIVVAVVVEKRFRRISKLFPSTLQRDDVVRNKILMRNMKICNFFFFSFLKRCHLLTFRLSGAAFLPPFYKIISEMNIFYSKAFFAKMFFLLQRFNIILNFFFSFARQFSIIFIHKNRKIFIPKFASLKLYRLFFKASFYDVID